MAAELEIIVLRGHSLVTSSIFTDAEVTIGRGTEALLSLDDETVSPNHAVVHFTGRTCLIEDVESSNGLFVGEERVRSHIVKANDEVRVGCFTLRFVIHGQTSSGPVKTTASGPVKTTSEPPKVIVAETPRATSEESDKTQLIDLAAVKSPAAPEPKPQPRSEPEPEAKTVETKIVEPKAAPAKQLKRTVIAPKPTPPKAIPSKAASAVDKRAGGPPSDALFDNDPGRGDVERMASGRALLDAETETIGIDLARSPMGARAGDDEDEEEPFVPAFSLVERLVNDKTPPPAAGHHGLDLEVVVARGETIERIAYLARGQRLKIPGEAPIVCVHDRHGRMACKRVGKLVAEVRKGTQRVNAEVHQDKNGQFMRADVDALVTVFDDAGGIVHLRFVPHVIPPKNERLSWKPLRGFASLFGLSMAIHLSALIVVSFMASERYNEDANEGRFVTVKTEDLELKEPPKPPEVVKTVEPAPAPEPEPAPLPQKRPKSPPPPTHIKQPKLVAAAAPAPAAKPQPSAAASKLMGALSALSGPSTSSAAAAATNLDAAVGAHTSGGFKVSGVIGKMPGGELSLSSVGGTGRINTKSGNEVGGKYGKIAASGGNGQVRAIVSAPPSRAVEVQGQLDRNEIQKVVNGHLAEVQGCYERQLFKDPSLNGKVICEWVIDPNGNTVSQRIKTSTVRNSEVASCILAALRNWKFPKPRGGSVTVTYPFVFSTIGM